SEFGKVKRFAAEQKLANIICLPYQPLEQLSGSLSAADLHVVVMGDPFVGTIHPCKIYNVLGVGAPLLCIGPEPSHLADILTQVSSAMCARVAHGDADACAREVRRIAAAGARGEAEKYAAVAAGFSQRELQPRFIAELERAVARKCAYFSASPR